MSHASFATGVLPGVSSGSTSASGVSGGGIGTASGVGSALLPTVTAELRSEFVPLLATLAGCKSDLASTYVMELFFTLVRFDAVLKAKERQLFVATAQQLITRQLQQLQKVHHTRTLLDENERFVGELVERCAALECLCLAPDYDEDGAAADGAEDGGADDDGDANDVGDDVDNQTNDFGEGSGHTTPTLRLDDTDDGHGDGGETVRSVATTRPAATSATRRRHAGPGGSGGGAAAGASSAPTLVGSSHTFSAADLRRFSFDDSLDDIVGRVAALQHRTPHPHRRTDGSPNTPASATDLAVGAGDGASGSGSAGTNTDESSPLSHRQRHLQRPPPLPLSWAADGGSTATAPTAAGAVPAGQGHESAQRFGGGGGGGSLNTTLPRRITGHANSTKTSPSSRGAGAAASLPGASPAGAGDVTPAVYTGVQHALQEHFRNNVRRTLTGGAALTVPNNLNELVFQQQQQQALPDASPTSSPGPARCTFPAALSTAVPPPVTNLSIFSVGTMTSQSALYPNGSFQFLGIDAGGPLGLTLGTVHSSSGGGGGGGGGGGLSSGCSPTTQDPVDTARVWDRVFWRFLDGRSATGDLAVLLDLLNTGNRAHAPALASGTPGGGGGGGGGKSTVTHAAGRGGNFAGGGGGGGAAKGLNATSTALAAGSLSSATVIASPSAVATSSPAAGGAGGGASGNAAGAAAGHVASAVGGSGDAAGAPGPRGPSPSSTPNSPEFGATTLMGALQRSGSYSNLLPPLSPPPLVVSGGTAATMPATEAAPSAAWHDTSTHSSGGVRVETTAVAAAEDDSDGSVRQQQQQQQQVARPGEDAPGPLPPLSTARIAAPVSHASTGASTGSGSNTVLLNLEDFAREEETRLHRNFWTHIPAILATLTEGLMFGGGGEGGSGGDGAATGGGAAPASKRHRSGSRHLSAADLTGGEVASAQARGGGEGFGGSGRDAYAGVGDDGDGAAAAALSGRDAGGGDDGGGAEPLGELHPPCAEALQLLPTFSPLLRNYTAAVQRVIRQAPEYARTTQTQHARAFAVVAAAAAASANMTQSQSNATTPRPNADGTLNAAASARGGEASPETERSGTVTPAPAAAADSGFSRISVGGGGGLTRTATQRTSVTDLPELKDSSVMHGAGRAQASSASPAPADTTALEHSLLNTGSRSHVRPIDVVAYALVTAIYVQCATALESRQQQQQYAAAAAVASGAGGRATAAPASTTAGAGGVSPFEDGCIPDGDASSRVNWTWPVATPSGTSLAADVAAPSGAANAVSSTAATTANTVTGAAHNSASLSAPGDEERAFEMSVANMSLTNAGVGGGTGWWWNGSLSGGGGGGAGPHSRNASIGLVANNLYYPYMQPLASALRSGGPGNVGGYVSNGSFQLLQHHHHHHQPQAQPGQLASPTHGGAAVAGASSSPTQRHARHPPTPRLQPLLHNFSFDTAYSPTDAALSLLRTAQEEVANGVAGDVGAGDACGCSNADGSSTTAAAAAGFPKASLSQLPAKLPRGNLHAMQLPSPDLVNCANDFSWVSLPSVMKAELQHLQQQLRDASRSVLRMEGQVRGELALLLFRVLSLVLDWLMPAVYVADQRVWLFYRKWCCDLYRVLCTDAALLEEFHRLLNQSGVAISGSVAASTPGPVSPRMRRAASLRDAHGISGRARASSAASTPTLRPAREPASVAAMAMSGVADGMGMARTPPQPRPHRPGSPTAALASVLDVLEESARDPRVDSATAPAASATAVSLCTVSPLVDVVPHALEDAFSFILPGSSLAVSVWHERPPMLPGVRSLLEQEEANRRGEAWVDTASLRAAKALLGGEGTVVPLPRPVLITRLVAATLRGIDADVAESLLWVVGQARAFDADVSHRPTITDADARKVSNMSSSMGSSVVELARAPGQPQQHQQPGRAASVASHTRGRHARRYGDLAAVTAVSGENDDDAFDKDAGAWSPPRRASHAVTRTMSGQPLHNLPAATTAVPAHHHRQHRSISADTHPHQRQQVVGATHVPSSARVAGVGGYTVHSEGDSEDEHDDTGYGDHWFGEADRRRRSHAGPMAPVQSPVMERSPGALLAASMNASPLFSRTDTHASFTEVNPGSTSPQLSHAPQLSEGPTLVHHHRFRYPVVHGYADVAKLYLSTLEEAELVLSAHDPVYASLVLSAADLHLHDLHDRTTAASLVNAYLADVSGEHIQAPVWEALPAVPAADGAGAAPGGAPSPTLSATVTRPAAPGKGFSVTRVRQGNTQGPTSTTAGPTTAAPTPASSPPPLQQQQPHVPMVIASWNNEGEKDEFIATLQLLRQMQLFLAASAGADGGAATSSVGT